VTSEVAQRKTRGERRDVRVFSGPVDPEYDRILGSTTFSSNHEQDRSTHAAVLKSSGTRREDEDPFGPSNANEDVTNILSDWDRRYRRKDNYNIKLVNDSQDSAYEKILNSEAALTPVNGTTWTQQASTFKLDEEYCHIFRQHDFNFHDFSPAKDLICLDCNARKPVTQYSGHRQICNDCHLAESAAEDSAVGGTRKSVDPSYLNQCMEDEQSTTSDSTILSRKKPQARESRPSGFVDSKNILQSLSKPGVHEKLH
jgi:hypothetical protein